MPRSLMIMTALAASVAAVPAQAGSFTKLFDFGPLTGNNPSGAPALDAQGNIYSYSFGAAAYPNGTVFEVSPPAGGSGAWSGKRIYVFAGGADGAQPNEGILLPGDGSLIGAARAGGAHGGGQLFRLTPPAGGAGAWSKTSLHDFGGAGDLTIPDGALVMDAAGNIYGCTGFGSVNGGIYELTPQRDGTYSETILYTAPLLDGPTQQGGISLAANGTLYVEWVGGGTSNNGYAMSLTPPAVAGGSWTPAVLHQFGSVKKDARHPHGPLAIGPDGALYGHSFAGGAAGLGAIFKLTPPAAAGGSWTETLVHSFTGAPGDGAENGAGVVLDANGVLWTTTKFGGTANKGALVGVQASTGTVSEIYSFTSKALSYQPTELLLPDGAGGYFGETAKGGVDNQGSLYHFTP